MASPFRLAIGWALAIALPALGCQAAEGERVWGADARLWPPGERVAAGAAAAVGDPWTWAPLLGVGVFAFGDLDEEVSDWARAETPLFGDNAAADRWSDDLSAGLRVLMVASTVLTPAGPGGREWLGDKARPLLLQALAVQGTSALTGGLKRATDRERPDASDRLSFPSGHTSGAFAAAAWTAGTLPAFELTGDRKRGATLALRALAIGTGWARIEAGQHYPTDVLAGAALGNFVARFVQGSFLGEGALRLEALVDPGLEQVLVGIRLSF